MYFRNLHGSYILVLCLLSLALAVQLQCLTNEWRFRPVGATKGSL
jgi:hypothetical protein